MSSKTDLKAVQARRSEIAKELAKYHTLVEEDKDLEIAEQVLIKLAGRNSGRKVPKQTQEKSEKFGAADTITNALSEIDDPWITSNALSDYLENGGNAMPNGTLRPLISRMIQKGVIVRRDFDIALASRVQK